MEKLVRAQKASCGKVMMKTLSIQPGKLGEGGLENARDRNTVRDFRNYLGFPRHQKPFLTVELTAQESGGFHCGVKQALLAVRAKNYPIGAGSRPWKSG